MIWLKRLFWFSVVIALALAELGCATKGPLRPSDEVRSSLGRVAVVTAGSAAEADLSYPAPGSVAAATAGAGTGLGAGVAAGAVCFGTYGLLWPACFIALWTPVMVVNGAVEGVVKAVPIKDVKSSARSLKAAVREINVQEVLRDGVVEMARCPGVAVERNSSGSQDPTPT